MSTDDRQQIDGQTNSNVIIKRCPNNKHGETNERQVATVQVRDTRNPNVVGVSVQRAM
jgi:hypothetical protein